MWQILRGALQTWGRGFLANRRRNRSWWFGHRTARTSSMHSCCGPGALLRGAGWRIGPAKHNPFGIYPAVSISRLLLTPPSCPSGTTSPSAVQVQQALNGPEKVRVWCPGAQLPKEAQENLLGKERRPVSCEQGLCLSRAVCGEDHTPQG